MLTGDRECRLSSRANLTRTVEVAAMPIILRRLGSCIVICMSVVAAVVAAPSQESGPPRDPATQSGAAKPGKAESEKIESRKCGKIERFHALADVFLASQPAKDDFAHVKQCGVKTVLNLRARDEIDWDEAEVVKSLGLEYVNIPFKSPETLTDDVFDSARKLLNDKTKRPILVHCASANRVGAIWLAHRVLDGGKSYEDARKEAQTVGLKLPALEAKAKDYIERMQKKSASPPKVQ